MTTAGDQHQRVSELLGAFVLHAVEPDESEMVVSHLEECHRCRVELDQLQEVAAAIGNVTAPPSAALWDRIAQHLGEPGTAATRPSPSLDRPVEVVAGPGALGALREPGAPQPDHPNRRYRRSAAPRRPTGGARSVAVVGAVAACAALAAVFGIGWSNANGRAGQLQDALARRGPGAAVAAALVSPGHRVVDLRSSSGSQVAELVVRRNGAGYVVSSRMPALPGDETYQLWAEIADQPISLGLLGSEPGRGDAFSLGTAVADAAALMVTVEPSGGVVTPDRGPVARATLG